MAEVNNRPVFKMNNDFWNQPRGPPQSMAQNLSNSNQNSPVPGSTNSVSAHSPSQQSNSSQNHVITQGALALQQAHAAQQAQQQAAQHNQQLQQAQQNNPANQSQPNQQGNPMTQNQNQNSVQQQQPGQPSSNPGQQQPQHGQQLGSPNAQSQAHAHAQALAQAQAQAQAAQQQLAHMAQQQQLGSGQNTPDKMTEKFVNDLQIFMHKSAMQMHARELTGRSEVKPHQCQQCLKSFSSNHQLVQHIRVHTGEKPYKCSYCDRRFKQLSHVQQHTRLHTGERPYKCHLPDCGRAFIQLSNLQQHLRNHDAQVERAKNRPFHCNICGKGFATESSLRTHTSKVSHCLGRLQQHAALIGGPNATSCPLCHKMFLGGEALMEHMKHTHKDPNASGVATKRRTANHPCPVCGKHYVNEGSLRKHLACHPETSQLSSSLRMWPCSVCQAVFTHESGLLTHMEHMRMDPKHQFAAQYVLSRAAAERRERENLLAAVSSGSGLLGLSGIAGNSSASPMCPSPSAHSDSSSGNGRLSSAGSEAGGLNNNNNNCNTKLGDMLRSNNGLHQYNVEEQLQNANRMAVIANMVGQGAVPPGLGYNVEEQLQNANRMAVIANMVGQGAVPPGLGSDSSAAANIAAANIANLAMRLGVTQANQVNNSSNPSTPPITNETLSASVNAMNAMRAMDSIRNMDAVRSSVMDMSSTQPSQQQDALRMHQQAEALLRTQAEAALRLAMSQALPQLNQHDSNSPLRHNGNYQGGHQAQSSQQLSPDLTEALRLQEQRLEQALRLHGSDPRSLGFSLSGQQQNQQP
ncbi:Zinc finger, C2H2 type [Popillia japonica]|uniref:Zinc finger, C2H2 type n=1 Tax=Popillia japonica TaxID=7064 RepID=A0AAW1MIV7_POPJA